MTKPTHAFHASLLRPKYWLLWIGFAVIIPLVLLPLRLQLIIGHALGITIFHTVKKRRHETLINLQLCFPNESDETHYEMAKAVFANAGAGIFESLSAWFRPSLFHNTVTIDGLEHINHANKDHGVLLLGAHYTLLDLGGLLCAQFFKADIVYRPQNNALLEWFIHRVRTTLFNKQIAAVDVRNLAASLKAKHIVWYTPDQDFGLKHGVMAPFFGHDAATITAPRRLARIGNTKVLAVHFYRTTPISAKHPQYHITLTPELKDYPTPNEIQDAERINTLLAELICIAPTQYMWFHRRFKTQINGMNPYDAHS